MTTGAPVAYFWGDDVLGLRRAVERFAADLAGDGEPLETWRADSADPSLTDTLSMRLATAPLFGGGVLAVVGEPVAMLRSKEDQDRVLALLDRVAPGNGLAFAELSSSGAREPAAASARIREAIEHARGVVRRMEAPPPGRLEPWIAGLASELGIDIEQPAVRLLAERVGGGVREGDVDRRHQTELVEAHLQLLALYRPDTRIRRADVDALVVPTVPSSAWAFLDAVGMRRAGEAATVGSALLADGTALPVVVTQLHRRLRQLLEIRDRLAGGAAPGDMVRLLRLNPYRAEILVRQAMRWEVEDLADALVALLEVDLASKGLSGDARAGAGPMTGPLALGLWIAERVPA